MTKFFVQFPKEIVAQLFWKKINLTSKSSSGHIECIIDNTLEKAAQIRKRFTQSPVTIKKQKTFRKISRWILSLNA